MCQKRLIVLTSVLHMLHGTFTTVGMQLQGMPNAGVSRRRGPPYCCCAQGRPLVHCEVCWRPAGQPCIHHLLNGHLLPGALAAVEAVHIKPVESPYYCNVTTGIEGATAEIMRINVTAVIKRLQLPAIMVVKHNLQSKKTSTEYWSADTKPWLAQPCA